MQRKCTKSKRLRSTNSNQATNKAANHKMTLAKITKVKGTITGHNHMENVNSLPVSQQYQLQRDSSKVLVSKQRRLTQVLAWGVEIQDTDQASHALQQSINAKLAARLATSQCLTKPKTVNPIAQEELAYLNAWQDDSSFFICQI